MRTLLQDQQSVLLGGHRGSTARGSQATAVPSDLETLYFPYYEYVRSHPITHWPHKTYILRGEKDTLCEYSYVKSFSDRFECELTEQSGGEHWFHTEEQLAFFRLWIRKRLSQD